METIPCKSCKVPLTSTSDIYRFYPQGKKGAPVYLCQTCTVNDMKKTSEFQMNKEEVNELFFFSVRPFIITRKEAASAYISPELDQFRNNSDDSNDEDLLE